MIHARTKSSQIFIEEMEKEFRRLSMTENKGDLISRSALRKAFKNHPLCNGVWLQYSREIIDNAPTIEPFEKIGAICDENCGYRLRGEWQVKDGLRDGFYICSNCGEISCCKGNFCPDCGAKMRRGGEES